MDYDARVKLFFGRYERLVSSGLIITTKLESQFLAGLIELQGWNPNTEIARKFRGKLMVYAFLSSWKQGKVNQTKILAIFDEVETKMH